MSIFSNPASSSAADTASYVAALLDLIGDKDPVAVLRETTGALRRFLETCRPGFGAAPRHPANGRFAR